MPKVMVIEDDKTMLSLLNTLLQIEGYQVVTDSDETPENIIIQIQQEHPDIVLMDIYLRQGNGLDVLQCIRKDPTLSNVRMLMSSGMNYKEQCMGLGADGFLLKPYMPDALLDLIRQSLEKPSELVE